MNCLSFGDAIFNMPLSAAEHGMLSNTVNQIRAICLCIESLAA